MTAWDARSISRRRFIEIAGGTVGGGLILAACGGSSSGSSSSASSAAAGGSSAGAAAGATTAAAASSGSGGKMTLLTYDNPDGAKAVRAALAGFKGATVSLDTLPGTGAPAYTAKLKTELLGGGGPDVIRIYGGTILEPFATAQQFVPLEPYYAKYGWDKRIGAGAIGDMTIAGKKFGAPLTTRGMGFWYRTDLFAKAGAKVPTTYAELEDAATKLRAAGYDPLIEGGEFGWDPMRHFQFLLEKSAGPQLHDQLLRLETTWDRPEVVEAFTLYKKWVDNWINKGFLGLNPDSADAALIKGTGAMLLTGEWEEGNIVTAKVDPKLYDTFLAPTDQTPQRYSGFTEGYSISANAKNPDLAAELIDYLLQPATQKVMDIQGSAALDVTPDAATYPLTKKWIDWQASKEHYLVLDQALPDQLVDSYKAIQSSVSQGSQSPKDAATAMQKAAEAAKKA